MAIHQDLEREKYVKTIEMK